MAEDTDRKDANPWLENIQEDEMDIVESESENSGSPGSPLTVGAILEGLVVDVAFGGEGVVRHNNQVVFVAGVITGEMVRIEIGESKKNFSRGRLVEVLQSSPERTAPECGYYGVCGGCQYQHINYAAQLRIKAKQVRDIFERIGKISKELVMDVLPCPQPYQYRNRIMVRTQWNREKKSMDVGFLKYQSRLVIPIKKCQIAEPELNEQLTQISINPSRNNGVKYVLRKFPENWTIPNDSFFQNNFFLLPGMVNVVRGCHQSFGGQYLVDAYCGVGFFAIELASQVREFVGVEIDRMAIKAARKNAADKGVSNGEFLEGATEKLLPEIMQKFPAHQTTVVLDPPRRGIDPSAIDFLKSIAPGQIIYISCHPATQARDIAQFCADNQYSVMMIKPMDMFPQTQHIECVADLRLNLEK